MDSNGHRGVFGIPLTQVFSITIKSDGDVCEVYGTVRVIDELGELYIYNRDPNDAETFHKYGTISLISSARPISAAAIFTVELDLKEKSGNMEFIKESFSWNGPDLFSYANTLSHNFRGNLGLATMYFSVLSVAVDATFAFALDDVLESGSANVYGRIVAYYGQNFDCLIDDNLKHNFRFILFDRTYEEAVELKDGDYIPLLNEFASVPSYSSLVFEAELNYTHSCSDRKGSLKQKFEILAWEDSSNRRVDGGFILTVEWKNPNRIMRTPSLERVGTKDFGIQGRMLLELFSARIFYDQTTVEGSVEVYGGIHVEDGHNDDMSLFSCRKNYSLLLPDDTLALTGPTCAVKGSDFMVTLDVKERHQKFILDGCLTMSPSYRWDWPDSLMCAAVAGKDCYGVLHFVIFGNAVQANVEVTLSSRGNTTLHGSLIAYYDIYDYKSDYLKSYFRTRLLDVPEDKPINVLIKPAATVSSGVLEDELMSETKAGESNASSNAIEEDLMHDSKDKVVELKHEAVAIEGEPISLSRNVIAVPYGSSLVIEANLSCSTSIDISKSVTRLVNGIAIFSPQSSGATSAQIQDKDVVVDVKVSWLNAPFSALKRYSSDKKNKFN